MHQIPAVSHFQASKCSPGNLSSSCNPAMERKLPSKDLYTGLAQGPPPSEHPEASQMQGHIWMAFRSLNPRVAGDQNYLLAYQETPFMLEENAGGGCLQHRTDILVWLVMEFRHKQRSPLSVSPPLRSAAPQIFSPRFTFLGGKAMHGTRLAPNHLRQTAAPPGMEEGDILQEGAQRRGCPSLICLRQQNGIDWACVFVGGHLNPMVAQTFWKPRATSVIPW